MLNDVHDDMFNSLISIGLLQILTPLGKSRPEIWLRTEERADCPRDRVDRPVVRGENLPERGVLGWFPDLSTADYPG